MPARRRASDEDLLVASRTDGDAFAELYRRYEAPVLRYFMYWTRAPDLAADLMAETFALAFASLASYRPELGEARAWLFGVARNVLARSVRRGRVEDATRRRLGMRELMIDEGALEQIDALLSQDGAALDALEGLSDLLREAVDGRVVQEREYRDLAAAMRCSESVVRQRVKRGLARMRERLETPR